MTAKGVAFRLLAGLIVYFGASHVALAQPVVPDDCGAFKKSLPAEGDERDEIESASYIARTFLWENDLWVDGGDFNYTNGMKFSWLHAPCRHRHKWLKEPYRRALVGVFGDDRGSYQVHSGGLFGMNMYTPNNLAEPGRIRTDRPYVGWVYFGYNLQASNTATAEDHQLELQLGFTGPATAQREAQEYIHRNISNSQISQGWDHQVERRFGLNALYAYRKDLFPDSSLRFVPHAGFSLGNLLQFVNAGGLVLLGKSANDYPGTSIQPLHVDFNRREQKGISVQSVDELRPGRVYYLFAGLDARYVFSSVFVEGAGESKHDIDLIHDVYDLIAGITFGGGNFRFTYKYILRSKEFTSPDPAVVKSHRIGQLGFTWFF